MSHRTRVALYGFLSLLVVAGIVCLVVVPGDAGGLLAIVGMGGGLGGATLMFFMEVGLSEDRERDAARAAREREQAERERAVPRGPRHADPTRLRPLPRRPRRLGR